MVGLSDGWALVPRNENRSCADALVHDLATTLVHTPTQIPSGTRTWYRPPTLTHPARCTGTDWAGARGREGGPPLWRSGNGERCATSPQSRNHAYGTRGTAELLVFWGNHRSAPEWACCMRRSRPMLLAGGPKSAEMCHTLTRPEPMLAKSGQTPVTIGPKSDDYGPSSTHVAQI